MSLLLILALAWLMHAVGSFNGTVSDVTTIAFGFVLLSAFYAGRLFERVRLPRLTGYIVLGILAGPAVFGLLSEEMVDGLKLVSGTAIALTALTAGNELDLRAFRPLLRSIYWITLIAVVGTALLLGVTLFLLKPLLPFMAEMSIAHAAAVALVLGVVMAAQSPAVVVALRDEMEADGPVSRTVLGVVVIADLVIILLFALTSSLTKSVFGSSGDADTLQHLIWNLLGSFTTGALVGLLIGGFFRFVRGAGALFIVVICFVIAEVGQRMDFDPLLMALTAGILIRNLTRHGEHLHREIELAALPVYVVFFAVAGAQINLGVLAVVGIPAVIIVLVRGFGLVYGAKLGSRIAQAPQVVQRYAGMGLLPQAGLALALAMLFSSTFPEFGAGASALTLGIVALNEIIAPAIYRWALIRSGEAGQRSALKEEAEAASAPAPEPKPLPAPRG